MRTVLAIVAAAWLLAAACGGKTDPGETAAAANSLARVYPPYCSTFSADGSKIVYLSGATSGPYIYTVNADGTGKVKFELEGGLWGEPYLSPDGKKVAFISHFEFFRNGNIFLVDIDGTNLTQVTAYGDDPFETEHWPDERTGVAYYGLTFSPDGRKILYCSAEFGTSDIFAINVDGTGKKRLTDFDGWEVDPVFLPDGDKILFTVIEKDNDSLSSEEGEIWIMNADGSAKKRLHGPFRYELGALSPDGKRIAYAERHRERWDTYVAALDGSSRFMFLGERLSNLDLSFSPDGKKVLYSIGQSGEIHITDADGTSEKNLTPGWVAPSDAAFFADGTEVAFVGSRRPGSADNIYTVDVDGSNLKAFKATAGMSISYLEVSPMGDRFFFGGDYYGGPNYDLFVVNADGTGLARVTTWYSEYRPYGGKFSADASKVAYLSNETGEYHIYTVNADGTGKVKFELEGGLWGEPYLSTDGKKVAFVNYYEFFQKGNIFLVDADGRNLTKVTAYGDDDAEITDDPDRGIGVLYEGLTFSPDGRKILYCSVEFGSKDIFAINVDGTGKTRLTAFADCEESGPVFLAGGDKVLFTVIRDLVHDEIWIMNADGSGKEKVPVPGYAELMAVSPDGKKIMARAMYPSEDPSGFTRGTFVADLDGSSPIKLAGEYKHFHDPSFSPDGKKVLFRRDGDIDAIYIINADGTGEKRLTRDWVGSSFSKPAFFANGAKIVFGVRMNYIQVYKPTRHFDNICTMDADGSNQKLFKAAEGTYFSEIVVSPRGDRFLFRIDYEDYEDGGPGDYFVVNADGSGPARLSEYDPPPWPTKEE